MFQEYRKENLFETVERLRRKEGRTTGGDISVLSFFREAAHADALVAVELYELGALSTILASFRTDNKDPKVRSSVSPPRIFRKRWPTSTVIFIAFNDFSCVVVLPAFIDSTGDCK